MLWQWPPLKVKNIVLVEGDSSVSHSGSKGTPEIAIGGFRAENDNDEFPSDLREELNEVLAGMGE
jgi:hypothetical protein